MRKAVIQPTSGVKVLNIEPCIIVIDRIRVDRAVSYRKEDLGSSTNPDGSEDAEWNTKRRYKSRKETEEANSLYNRIRYRLGTVCAKTDIGFVCPLSKAQELNDIINESQQAVEEANSRWAYCFIKFRIVCSELGPNNESGVQVLRDSMEEQTRTLKLALEEFDPKKARDALKASRAFVDMVADPEIKESLKNVQKEAKELATEIAKVVREYGSIANAVSTPQGRKILHRAKAPWSVF